MKSLGLTAALLPSSRYLAASLLKPVDFTSARVVAELGPGTGAITQEILKRLSPKGRLVALEANQRFVDHLRKNCRDPRLVPVCTSAEDLTSVLHGHGIERVDAIISSLGLTGMDSKRRYSIFRQAAACLDPAGVMTQYQYEYSKLHFSRFRARQFLETFFRVVYLRRVFLNLPPAIVFVCRH